MKKMEVLRESGPCWKNFAGRNFKLSKFKKGEGILFHEKELEYHFFYGYDKNHIPCIIDGCSAMVLHDKKFLPVVRYSIMNGTNWEEKEELFQLENNPFDFSLEEFYACIVERGPLMRITSNSSLKRLEDKRRESINRLNSHLEHYCSLTYFGIENDTDKLVQGDFDNKLMEAVLNEIGKVFQECNEEFGISCTRFEIRYFNHFDLKVSEEGGWLIYQIIPLILKIRKIDQMIKEKKE